MLYAAKEIRVGEHPTTHLFGLTINLDIVASTLLAAAIFLFLAFKMRSKVTEGVPGKLQLFWEYIVFDLVGELAESSMGPRGKKFVPIGVTLFIFILICNWIGFIPSAMHPGVSGEILPAPTSDVNLPLAMALLVVTWAHIEAFDAASGPLPDAGDLALLAEDTRLHLQPHLRLLRLDYPVHRVLVRLRQELAGASGNH